MVAVAKILKSIGESNMIKFKIYIEDEEDDDDLYDDDDADCYCE